MWNHPPGYYKMFPVESVNWAKSQFVWLFLMMREYAIHSHNFFLVESQNEGKCIQQIPWTQADENALTGAFRVACTVNWKQHIHCPRVLSVVCMKLKLHDDESNKRTATAVLAEPLGDWFRGLNYFTTVTWNLFILVSQLFHLPEVEIT